ncbi:MAG: hypothetical protein HY922_11230 [Elusimicrobia bacterium]|nr:hypothetical protein [Elusimicrobiota bacterium]
MLAPLLAAALLPSAGQGILEDAAKALSSAPAVSAAQAPGVAGFLLRHHSRAGDTRALERALALLKAQGEPLKRSASENALFAASALEAYQAARDPAFARKARQALEALSSSSQAAARGLVISAFAKGAQVLGSRDYLKAAEDEARRSRGDAGDRAFLVQGLLDLYESSFDPDWLDRAVQLGETLPQGRDDPAAAALGLLRLSEFARRPKFREAAERILEQSAGRMRSDPRAMAGMLCALDFALSKPKQVIIAGGLKEPDTRELLRLVRSRFIPNKILLVVQDDAARARIAKCMPFVKTMRPISGKATAYICLNYACEMPTSDLQTAADILDGKDILSRSRP